MILDINILFFYFRYGLYIIALSYFLKELNFKKYFLIIFLIVNIILFADSSFQFFTGYNLLKVNIDNLIRVSSFFYDEKILGSFITKISPLVISFLFLIKINNKSYLNIYLLILIVSNLFIVIISGERAALVLYILFCLYLFYFLEINKKVKIYFSLFILIFISIFLSLNKNAYNRLVDQTVFEITGVNLSGKKYYDSDALAIKDYFKNNCDDQIVKEEKCKNDRKFYFFTSTHHNYFITSLRIFNDHKLFGSGPKSFRVLCKNEKYKQNKFSCASHTHNYYIQLLSETGILGLLYLLILYIYFIFSLKRISNSHYEDTNLKNFYLTLLGGLLINFFPFITTGNFFNNWLSIISFLPIVYLLHDKNFNKSY